MKVPIHRLKKDEIIWLNNHTCSAHRHRYLDHYACYLKEQPDKRRTAILDIETSNLKADYGIVLTWCLLPLDTDTVIKGIITPADIAKGGKDGTEDRRIVKDCIAACLGFDKLITYYGKRFDVPYLRARSMHMREKFPYFGSIHHVDVYDIVKHRFCMSRKSQEVACRFLLNHTDKTHFDGSIWREAARGKASALKQVLDHNIYDVQDLKKLYLAVVDFSRRNDTSL